MHWLIQKASFLKLLEAGLRSSPNLRYKHSYPNRWAAPKPLVNKSKAKYLQEQFGEEVKSPSGIEIKYYDKLYTEITRREFMEREFSRKISISTARPRRGINDTDAKVNRPSLTVTHKRTEKQRAGVFAIFSLYGNQFKIVSEDLLVVNKIKSAKVGEILKFTNVLLAGGNSKTIIGRPLISGASVTALVQEQGHNKKIHVLRMKRRKNMRTWIGSRQEITLLRIKDIVCPGLTEASSNFNAAIADTALPTPEQEDK